MLLGQDLIQGANANNIFLREITMNQIPTQGLLKGICTKRHGKHGSDSGHIPLTQILIEYHITEDNITNGKSVGVGDNPFVGLGEGPLAKCSKLNILHRQHDLGTIQANSAFQSRILKSKSVDATGSGTYSGSSCKQLMPA